MKKIRPPYWHEGAQYATVYVETPTRRDIEQDTTGLNTTCFSYYDGAAKLSALFQVAPSLNTRVGKPPAPSGQ